MPWQQHAVDVALEVDPATGELWYEEVVITVPRQSGKTTLILALMVWRCITMARRLDVPQTVTYLAQSGKMARRKLEREFIPIIRRAKRWFVEVTHSRERPTEPAQWKPSMNNGSEHILWGTGSYLQIEAPTGTGSHGDVLDMSVIDEAFARQDDLVEQAVDAASVTRRSPQTFVVSTAGNKVSRFLYLKVLGGRKSVTDGVESRTCYLEWSLPDDAPFDDPDVWAQYLPALGHTITVQRLKARLEKAMRNPDVVDEEGYEPGIAGFRRGYHNVWMSVPEFDNTEVKSEIDPAKWEALTMPGSAIVGGVVIGVGVGLDGVSAAFVVCGRAADGVPQFEVFEHEQGVWWLERRLRDRCENPTYPILAVAWPNLQGPARPVAPEIMRGAQGVPTMPINAADWSAACEAFATAVSEQRVRHLGDLLLGSAVKGAIRKQTGVGWVWDLRDARADITPLIAATAALRALETVPVVEIETPKVFAY